MAEWRSPRHREDHFADHRHEGPWPSVEAYDASARALLQRDDVLVFRYHDYTTGHTRVGVYDDDTGLFTILSEDDRWIISHFRTHWGYVRGLLERG